MFILTLGNNFLSILQSLNLIECFLNVFRFNEFDHKFFGISDSEVEQMDPQQKQLLQCVYRALENAGIPMEKASGTRTGVFFGTYCQQLAFLNHSFV